MPYTTNHVCFWDFNFIKRTLNEPSLDTAKQILVKYKKARYKTLFGGIWSNTLDCKGTKQSFLRILTGKDVLLRAFSAIWY